MIELSAHRKTFKVFHLFAGSGGGALGFQQAEDEYKGICARFRTLGGIDVDPRACDDFEYLTGVKATCLDLFEQRDFIAFHGQKPNPDWYEATPADVMTAAGGEHPDLIFLSPPCKGFSGLLPQKTAETEKYQALNRLVVRGLFLALEAFREDLPAIILLENVPRINSSRGKTLLHTIKQMLHSYGYVTDDRTHDCGELGGLAQHRKRYLLIARLPERVPIFVYQPPKQRVRSIGEVLGPLPLPDNPAAGPMHRLPRLKMKTWVRLALIPAGGDWRNLEDIKPEEYRLEYVPRGRGPWGVQSWDKPSKTIIGNTSIKGSNGAAAIADPRLAPRENRRAAVYKVTKWEEPAHTVTGTRFGSGAPAVSDPKGNFGNAYRVIPWNQPSGTVTGGGFPSNGRIAFTDPRTGGGYSNKFQFLSWDQPGSTVTGIADIQSGAQSIADPRTGFKQGTHQAIYQVKSWEEASGTITDAHGPNNGAVSIGDPRFRCITRSGTMGVQDWSQPSKTVTGTGDVHSGCTAVADPRIPADNERPDPPPVIISLDGTRHRPLTTLELAIIQGLPLIVWGKPLQFAGKSDSAWRERIGNMVPPPAAKAMGEVSLHALLVASAGVTWEMSAEEIWVAPEPNGDSIQRLR